MKKKILLSIIIMFFSFFIVSNEVWAVECLSLDDEKKDYYSAVKEIEMCGNTDTNFDYTLTINMNDYFYIKNGSVKCYNDENTESKDFEGYGEMLISSLEQNQRTLYSSVTESNTLPICSKYEVSVSYQNCQETCTWITEVKYYFEKQQNEESQEQPKEETQEQPKEETKPDTSDIDDNGTSDSGNNATDENNNSTSDEEKNEEKESESDTDDKKEETKKDDEIETLPDYIPGLENGEGASDGLSCGAWGKVRDDLRNLFNFMKILIPLLIIGLSTYEFIKAVTAKDEKDLKNAFKSLFIRFVLAVVFFFLPVLIEVLLDLFEVNAEICIFKLF